MKPQRSKSSVIILIFLFALLFHEEIKSQSIIPNNSYLYNQSISFSTSKSDTVRPKVTSFAYFGEFAIGAVMGGLMAIPAAYIGYNIDRSGSHGEFAGLGGFIIGMGVGYLFGTALGVHLVDKGYHTGSDFGTAFLGSIAGALIGGLTLWQVDNIDGTAAGIIALASPIIGAIFAVNFVAPDRNNNRVKIHYSNFKINDELVHSINFGFRLN